MWNDVYVRPFINYVSKACGAEIRLREYIKAQARGYKTACTGCTAWPLTYSSPAGTHDYIVHIYMWGCGLVGRGRGRQIVVSRECVHMYDVVV